MAEKKKEEHTTFEVGPISESRMRAIMEELWQEGGAGREALAENITTWYKPELIRKSKAVADSFRNEFLHAWNGYKQYAWGHDELRPVSRTAYDWYGVPLGLTIVDSLDTLYLLELDDEFETAVDWVENNLSFNVAANAHVFELSIRWLGGLISAHLITGSKRLLELATDLGNRLLPAFTTSPTGIPYRYVNLSTGTVSGNEVGPAEIYSIELCMLSKLTGDNSYYTAAKNAVNAIYTRRSVINLVGKLINVDTGAWTSTESHIDDYIDSYFEYLYKAWLLFEDHDFLDWFNVLMGGISTYMEEIYNGMMWYRRVDMNTGALLNRYKINHSHFFAGLLGIAGRLTEAEAFTRSIYVHWMRWGLAPGLIDYTNMSIINPGFPLNPEGPESMFTLWRVTGKDEYRMMVYTMTQNIIKYCKTDAGFANISDVTTMAKVDYMPSYFLAETMKYPYLTWADSPRLNYKEALFTTEGHLMRGIVPT